MKKRSGFVSNSSSSSFIVGFKGDKTFGNFIDFLEINPGTIGYNILESRFFKVYDNLINLDDNYDGDWRESYAYGDDHDELIELEKDGYTLYSVELDSYDDRDIFDCGKINYKSDNLYIKFDDSY